MVARDAGPADVIVVLLSRLRPRNYLSKIFNDQWMFDMGFLRADPPVAGDVLAAKGTTCPTSC